VSHRYETCDFVVTSLGNGLFVHTCRRKRCARTETIRDSNYVARCKHQNRLRLAIDKLKPGSVLEWCISATIPDGLGQLNPDGGCATRRWQMNQWGWIGSARRLPTIYGWMKEQAARRGLVLAWYTLLLWIWRTLVGATVAAARRCRSGFLANCPEKRSCDL
jgi:hypothetical protein